MQDCPVTGDKQRFGGRVPKAASVFSFKKTTTFWFKCSLKNVF